MSTRWHLVVVATIVASSLWLNQTTYADRNVFESGLSCMYWNNQFTFQADLTYRNSMAENASTTQMVSVACPISSRGDSTQDAQPTRMYYRDGNDDAGFHPVSGSVGCDVVATQTDGTKISGISKYSCSTAGGCVNDNNVFVSPVGVATYLDIGSLNNLGTFSAYHFHCLIPYSKQSASSIIGYSTFITGG